MADDYGDVIYEIPWNDKMEDGQSVVKIFTSFDIKNKTLQLYRSVLLNF